MTDYCKERIEEEKVMREREDRMNVVKRLEKELNCMVGCRYMDFYKVDSKNRCMDDGLRRDIESRIEFILGKGYFMHNFLVYCNNNNDDSLFYSTIPLCEIIIYFEMNRYLHSENGNRIKRIEVKEIGENDNDNDNENRKVDMVEEKIRERSEWKIIDRVYVVSENVGFHDSCEWSINRMVTRDKERIKKYIERLENGEYRFEFWRNGKMKERTVFTVPMGIDFEGMEVLFRNLG